MKFRLILVALLFLVAGVASAQVLQGVDAAKTPHPIKTEPDSTPGSVQRLTPAIQQQTKQLDAMDATTGWAALSNDTTGLATDLDHVEGTNSLEFDKVDGAAGSTAGGIAKTLTSVDLTEYIASGGALSYSVNVSSLADIAYCFLRLGTSSSHYNEWRVDDDALATGWNWVRFNVYAPSTAGATGNGITWTAVTYAAVGCVFDAEDDALADLRFDNLEVIRGLQGTMDVSAQVSSSTAVSDVNVTELGSQSIDLGAGNVGTGTQRVTLAGDDALMAAIDADTSTIAGDTTSLDGKVTTTDADTGAGSDNIVEAVCMMPGSGGASMPDVGAGNVGTGTPRVTLAGDDALMAAISGKLTSDNDAKELSAYYDGTEQLEPLFCDDSTLQMDNRSVADILAETYEIYYNVYSAAVSGFRFFLINPDSSQHVEITLCSLTDVTANTSGTCGYWDMDGYRTFSVHCIASTTPTDTMTYNVECSVEDNTTAPASVSYLDVTTSLNEMKDNDHNASYIDEETILIPEFAVPFKYCKVDYVTSDTGGNDADLECFVKRMY